MGERSHSAERAAPTRVCGSICGLGGFSVAIIAGVAADNGFADVLLVGIGALVVCQAVGLAVGAIASHVLREHAESASAGVESESGGAVESGFSEPMAS